MRLRRRTGIVLALACLLVVDTMPARAYLHLSVATSSGSKPLVWNPARVRWFARDLGVPGVTASQMQTEAAKAFATWEAVPTASMKTSSSKP